MGLVDGNARKLALLVDRANVLSEYIERHLLWGHIQQACSRVAARQILKDLLLLRARRAGVESCHNDVVPFQSRDLVLHQAEKR